MKPISVVLADDHGIVREGLRSLIDRQPDMRVVAEAQNAAEAVACCKERVPDVAVFDLSMPGGGGLVAIGELDDANVPTRIIVFTMHDDLAHMQAVLEAGAAAYVVKRAAGSELLEAIREVHAGRGFIRASLSDPKPSAKTAADTDGPKLSPREREVLQLLALGHSNREVAQQIGVGKKSVDTYRVRLQEKLQLKGRAALVRHAMAIGLLEESDPEN